MSKAEEKALEAYPIDSYEGHDDMYRQRGAFTKGYEQAQKDFMKKACFWLECNLANLSEDDRKFWIEDFKEAMISE